MKIVNLLSDAFNNVKQQVGFSGREGKCIRFNTNAINFTLTFSVKGQPKGNYPHIGNAIRQGITLLYKKKHQKNWYNFDIYECRVPETVIYEEISFSHIMDEGEEYDVLIYGPVMSNLTVLEVSAGSRYYIKPCLINANDKPSIICFGGIHTYGCGVTSPGLMFSNLLGRFLEINNVRVAYNKKFYLKDVLDFLEKNTLSKFHDNDLFIIEYDYVHSDILKQAEALEKLLTLLKNNPRKVIFWKTIPQVVTENQSRIIIENLIESAIEQNKNMYKIDCSHLYNDENRWLMTHSWNYINDAGNIEIYKTLFNNIKKIWNI